MISSGGGFQFGHYDSQTEMFTSTEPRISSGLDRGDFGWSITNVCNDRTLTFGWLAATCGNCKPQVSPQRLSIVREVRYDPRILSLVSNPLPELSALHNSTLYDNAGKPLTLGEGQRTALIKASTLAARSMDLVANLSLAGAAATAAVHLQISVLAADLPDIDQSTVIDQSAVIDINVSAPVADGSRNGTMTLWTGSYPARSHAGSMCYNPSLNLTKASCRAAFKVLPHEISVDLRALVDHSSVEGFAMGGRAVISLAVVPNCTEAQFVVDECKAGQTLSGVSVQSSSGAVLSGVAVHSMSCGWTSDATKSWERDDAEQELDGGGGLPNRSADEDEGKEEDWNNTRPDHFVSYVLGPKAKTDDEVTFDWLTKVGENNVTGRWGKLDAHGVQIPNTCGDNSSTPCSRGEPGTTLLQSPDSSPRLLVLSPTAVVAMANNTAQISVNGGRSWSIYTDGSSLQGCSHHGRGGSCADIYDPYIPAPVSLNGSGFMDIRPVPAYPPSCKTAGVNCKPVSPVIASDENIYLDWRLSPAGLPVIIRSIGRRRLVWGGLPASVSMFCTECGGGAQLSDGSFVFLVAVQHTDPRADPYACCNNSVWAFTSRDGLEWTYTASVATMGHTRKYQEGFSENSVVLLKDNKTLWSVIRTDSCDGEPSHRTLPFLSATSTDSALSWTVPKALPDDMLSSTPKATVLGNGALLVAGGRPGVDLWVSLDGFGAEWKRYSLPTIHNALATRDAKPDWRYCEAFLPVAANHTFAGYPKPRIDNKADGAALTGWIASSGRVAVAAIEHNVALVTYDRQGWGGGYYGVGLPPVFGPLGTWPNGRAAPLGCVLNISTVFSMRVTVTVKTDDAKDVGQHLPPPRVPVPRTAVFTLGEQNMSYTRIPAIVRLGNSSTLLAITQCSFNDTWQNPGSTVVGFMNAMCTKLSPDDGVTWDSFVRNVTGKIVPGSEYEAEIWPSIGTGYDPSAVWDMVRGVVHLYFDTRGCRQTYCQPEAGARAKHWPKAWCISSKDGVNWSSPLLVSADMSRLGIAFLASPGGPASQLYHGQHKGRLLISGYGDSGAAVFYSDDAITYHQMKTARTHWSNCSNHGGPSSPKSGNCDAFACFAEPVVLQLPNGSVRLDLRNGYQAARVCDSGLDEVRYYALSSDGGASFGVPQPDRALLDPGEGCQAPMLTVGRSVYFSNPLSKTDRVNMTVRRSVDSGAHWSSKYALTLSPGTDGGGFNPAGGGYSSLTTLSDPSHLGLIWEGPFCSYSCQDALPHVPPGNCSLCPAVPGLGPCVKGAAWSHGDIGRNTTTGKQCCWCSEWCNRCPVGSHEGYAARTDGALEGAAGTSGAVGIIWFSRIPLDFTAVLGPKLESGKG
jgi:hypothetical protein